MFNFSELLRFTAPRRMVCTSLLLVASFSHDALADQKKPDPNHFNLMDVFELEYASDPQISLDGKRIVYVRNFMDIMKDRKRSNLWMVTTDGLDHRPLTSGNNNHSQPRWSPDGKRLLYVSSQSGSTQLYMRWMDTGQTAKITNLLFSPGGLSWSHDGKWIAFTMMVPESSMPFISMPKKPKDAEWAKPANVIRELQYRADGAGYLKAGYTHIFVVPSLGGTPRQITRGKFNHRGTPQWTPDNQSLIFSANRHENAEFDPLNSEIYEVSIKDGSIEVLTSRNGPDRGPVLSPNGKLIAYTGFDDHLQGYETNKLYVMNRDGTSMQVVTNDLDRSVGSPRFNSDGSGIYFSFDDRGNTKIGFISLADKNVRVLTGNVGGTSVGRPYASGSFSVSRNGIYAFTHSTPDHLADVVMGSDRSASIKRLTALNEDLFTHKKLGEVEEIWFTSSFDGRKIQGWIVKPPDFDPAKKYPLLLEIHGGPFANYGDRFSAEIQLYVTAGYVVLYTNPRGSTSYGQEFGNLIHHNYPGQDYDDLMSGVDTMIDRGYIDKDQLFVTGGSGGGVLTSWIVGHTDRFAAAVVAKPVINWFSFALTADMYTFFHKYWFPGYPWDYPEQYMKRSPISYVGNVTTPTMMLTGEEDYRTPMSETEQFYQALKLLKVETVMVRIPGASHGITTRPSNLISKVAHILKWFDSHKPSHDNETSKANKPIHTE